MIKILINLFKKMKYEKTLEDAKKDFESSILPCLEEFVRLDNLSPDYDQDWETNGKAEKE